jgi:hypothetical protein
MPFYVVSSFLDEKKTETRRMGDGSDSTHGDFEVYRKTKTGKRHGISSSK